MVNLNSNRHRVSGGAHQAVMAAVSLVAIGAAFGIASAPIDWISKAVGFSLIVTAFLAVTAALHFRGRRSSGDTSAADARAEQSLALLEEISGFFGGTIKTADAFRLVVSKAGDIVPSAAATLFVVDRADNCLRAVQAQGLNADKIRNACVELGSGIAGKCAAGGSVQIERGSLTGRGSYPEGALDGFRASAAVPLKRSGEVLAVLQFYSASPDAFRGEALSLLEAVGERATPMLLSALSYEQSMARALTDPVTDLPNERAFRLVLENQIAESHRRGTERALTILAIDIRGFDRINEGHGHRAGERLLALVAETVRGQLRQMDFFAHASNDEFLAILPTADEEVAAEIVGRINTALFAAELSTPGSSSIRPELNCGVAVFGKHGETAEAMVAAARLKKDQSPEEVPAKVIWFPGQFAN